MEPEKISNSAGQPEKSAIYSTEQYLKTLLAQSSFPGTLVKPMQAAFSIAGLPVLVNVSPLISDPTKDGSSDDVMRVSVYLPEGKNVLDSLREEGYSLRLLSMLHLTPEIVTQLKLGEDREKMLATLKEADRLPHGRELEYTVTREELSDTLPTIAAFLKAKAVAFGLSDEIEREELLQLVRGGLVGSTLANLKPNVGRPEPDEIMDIEVPLSPENRAILDPNNPMRPLHKLVRTGDKIALAVLMKGEEWSEDYALARSVVCRELANYYHSPQSSDNRGQFEEFNKKRAVREQLRLEKQFEAQGGYRLENFVMLPKPEGPATFELPLSEGITASMLEGSSIQTHYATGERTITDPDTNEQRTIAWLDKKNEFIYGPRVDEIIASALKRGYMVMPVSELREPRTKELTTLWDLIHNDLWDSKRRPSPVEAFVSYSPGTPELGKTLYIYFSDEAVDKGGAMPEALIALRKKLDEAFERLPEAAKAVVRQKREKDYEGHTIYGNGDIGNITVCERYPEMMEIFFEYLRARAAVEWQKSHPQSH